MDGIILINKEKGYTSHDIVNIIKKTYNTKVGHTGTLDPNATGVLPILLGKGTKISKYLINHDKEYIATLKLGIKTTTADGEGDILEERNVNKDLLDINNIEKVLNEFIGISEQRPPMFSAIKVNGKKLYEYARKGQSVDIKPRKIEIYDFELLNINIEQNEIEFRVKCSKGTYIRTLCENIAEKLGTIGYMKELKRTKVGDFDIQNSVTIDQVKNNSNLIKILTIEDMFKTYNSINIDDKQTELLLNGVKIKTHKTDGIYKLYSLSNVFIGVGIVENESLKIDIRV